MPCNFHEMRKNVWKNFHFFLFTNFIQNLDSICVHGNLLSPNFSAHGFNPAFQPKHILPKVAVFPVAVCSNSLWYLLSAYLFWLLIPRRWPDKEPKSIAGVLSLSYTSFSCTIQFYRCNYTRECVYSHTALNHLEYSWDFLLSPPAPPPLTVLFCSLLLNEILFQGKIILIWDI